MEDFYITTPRALPREQRAVDTPSWCPAALLLSLPTQQTIDDRLTKTCFKIWFPASGERKPGTDEPEFFMTIAVHNPLIAHGP